ncbi:MAG: peptidoglycan-binding protein [Treponema sp.]|nr:peptidoglycan-binding protein [Treponema sp.]
MSNDTRSGCAEIRDMLFEQDDEGGSMLQKLRIKIHLLFCPGCAAAYRQLEICGDLIRSGFFPPSPSFEDRIMEQIAREGSADDIPADEITDTVPEVPGGFSFRAWVIIGFFIFASLTSSFIGMDSYGLVSKFGSSFLVPAGITVGIMLTGYGAFFIGSHLKELTEHFKLR